MWGGGNVNADGVGILFRGWGFDVQSSWEVVAGRMLCVDFAWQGRQFRCVNVYAPSVPGERGGFFDLLRPLLFTNRATFLGGDFNVSVDGPSDGGLGAVVAAHGLRDAFRVAGDGSDGCTWGNSRGARSRLDYLFVSEWVGVCSFVVCPVWLSDHCLVSATLAAGGARRPGLWRLNTSLLEDATFTAALGLLYKGWRAMRVLYNSWGAWWEGTKARIACFCRRWSQERPRKRREAANRWSAELGRLWRGRGAGCPGGRERARAPERPVPRGSQGSPPDRWGAGLRRR